MRSKYGHANDGEWIAPKRREYRLICCDCGLVHRLNFRLAGTRRQIQFQAFRDERATGQIRRYHALTMTNREP